jgi:hypothetical protein
MKRKRQYSNIIVDLLLLSAIEVFMMAYLDVRYLFLDTVVTGGDTASWHGIADHLMKVLLPEGRLTGWDMGNFCGYPNFSFYFIPPFLLAAVTSTLFPIPLTITLKCVIVLGIFLLPVMTYLGLRALEYRFPIPAIGASVSMLFLFNESYTMFGGNIVSTLTGEFCYMIAFAFFAYFIGSLYKGVTTGTGGVKNGILLGLIGLTHLFVFIPAVCLLIYWFLAKGKLRYLFKVSLIAFGLMAFWILPLMAYRDPFTTPVYMIWQPFVNWRYAFVGIGLGLVFIGPRLALAALSSPSSWGLPLVSFSGLGAFTFMYLGVNYLGMGPGFWDTGLDMTPLSASPVGEGMTSLLSSWAVPLALCLSLLVMAIGFRAWKSASRFQAFCAHTGAVAFLAVLILSSFGLYSLIARSFPSGGVRTFLLEGTSFALLGAFMAGCFLLFYGRFTAHLAQVSLQTDSQRFTMFLALILGCVVGYFSAHFLQIPDIRFLPPLLFILMLILFADTFEPLLGQATISPSPRIEYGAGSDPSRQGRGKWGALILCGCIVTVIFGTTRADHWFRFNTMGYESMPGFGEFRAVNAYLRQAYKTRFSDPLNAPRVGYEKSDLYGRYGGDRVFESLHFFSGRQTLEGIHYASSFASKPMAFLQTAFSRDIKTPVPYILSRMNPAVLPSYFDLYNISQLILVSDEAKKAIQTSSLFEKEADFGPLSVYRYRDCQGLYVDVPKLRPVIYTGKNWVRDFFQWYKTADQLEVLMVPKAYVTSRLDRDILSATISNLHELHSLKKSPLNREGLSINAHLEPLGIRFTTNKVGLPHLIKVSYFPNWDVKGAEGVYPVSPHLMLVIPREKEVVLTYGRSLWDYVGVVITLGTLVFLILTRIPRIKKPQFFRQYSNPSLVPHRSASSGRDALEKGGPASQKGMCEELGSMVSQVIPAQAGIQDSQGNMDILDSGFHRSDAQTAISSQLQWGEGGKARPFLAVLVLLTAAGLIIAGAILRNQPVRTYVNGYRSYQLGNQLLDAKKVQEAKRFFEKAVEEMAPIVAARHSYDHQDVIHCILFTAMSLERLGEASKAEDLYGTILKEYPYSRYVGECYVKIARVKKAGRDPAFEEAIIALGRGDQAQALPRLKKALDQTELSLAFLRRAMAGDPYSVWAKYAGEDLEAERAYLKPKLPLLRGLCDDVQVQRSLSSVCSENPLGFQ